MPAILFAAAGYCLIVLFIIKGIKFVTRKPLEETAILDEAETEYFDNIKIVPHGNDLKITKTITV